MSRPRAIVLAWGLLASGAVSTVTADSGLANARITNLRATVRNSELLVSFSLQGPFSEEVAERLHSGRTVTFRHRVDMFLRRPFFLVPNKLLGRTTVETRVAYDSLTRQYNLQRLTENKTKRKGKDDPFLDFEVRRSTESLQEAVNWLTELRDVPLPWRPDVGPPERIRVRVNSNLGRHFVFLFFPSTYSASAELGLEF